MMYTLRIITHETMAMLNQTVKNSFIDVYDNVH